VAELPAIDAVSTIYRGAGDHDLIGPVYGQMARYAEDHGYSIHGPGRDHVVSFDGSELVFELQLPVVRSYDQRSSGGVTARPSASPRADPDPVRAQDDEGNAPTGTASG
jgi:hypothetical protein